MSPSGSCRMGGASIRLPIPVSIRNFQAFRQLASNESRSRPEQDRILMSLSILCRSRGIEVGRRFLDRRPSLGASDRCSKETTSVKVIESLIH